MRDGNVPPWTVSRDATRGRRVVSLPGPVQGGYCGRNLRARAGWPP